MKGFYQVMRNSLQGLDQLNFDPQEAFDPHEKEMKLIFDGLVDHNIKDVYDFNKKDKEFFWFKKQADDGKAKPFLIYGSKPEKVKGKIILKNGQISEHRFDWQNSD